MNYTSKKHLFSNLLRKDHDWYSLYAEFRNIPDNLPYIWPVR